MARYRSALPQLGSDLFLTDGGIETTLIFHEGLELPDFATFPLLGTAEGRDALRKYFRAYGDIARRFGVGVVLESATWRANPDWAARLGYDAAALAEANRGAIGLLEEIRDEYESEETPVVISGCVGPRGDGYSPGSTMSEEEAHAYHREQIDTFADTAADLVTALTMNYVEEAIGVVRAAREAVMPVVIAFTVETDGRLPTGQSLKGAIEQVDSETSGYASYFMINCAHPSHFEHVVAEGGAWVGRLGGLRANASRLSHAELDEAEELDSGDPVELGENYARLKGLLPALTVMGGCCGTDHRHVGSIAERCVPLFRVSP
ncbi:MAG: homocysteine S-methyltransferase family protein [Gemmatimonadota bacterium]